MHHRGHQTDEPSGVRPNMVDRLFLRLEGLQTPAKIHCLLRLEGRIDPAVLVESLQEALNAHPLLRTRVHETWSAHRRMLLAHENASALLESHPEVDPARIQAFVARPVDLSRDAPVRLLLQQDEDRAELVLAIHHSVSDAIGGWILLDRLARTYSLLLAGEPVVHAAEPDTRSYWPIFRRLKGADRWRVALRFAATLRELVDAMRGVEFATFTNRPLAGAAQVRWQTLTLPPEQVKDLRALARHHQATLNDVLLAAFTSVAHHVWPQGGELPIMVQMPVNLRDDGWVGVANRVAEVPIRLEGRDGLDFEGLLKEIRVATVPARERVGAIARVFERALVSRMPPRLFRRVLGDHLARPKNATLSFAFSNLGNLDQLPADFGTARVLEGAVLGPLCTPPGLSAWVTTIRGRLTLCVGYVHPAVEDARVAELCAGIQQELESRVRTRNPV